MDIVFATNNENKTREIRNILGNYCNLLSLNDLNIKEDIPENEPTLEGNALYKARYIHNILNMNVFADDTGLEVDFLNGLPGVKSARFAGENNDSDANIDKLLSMMGNSKNRKARFRTVIALILEGEEYIFEGIVNGRIISVRRGSDGFGYDPVFVPEGYTRTFAEMSLTGKNKISHRARAIEKLRIFLDGYYSPQKK
ncbi:MAG TPA: non-canonical purine NTP diphosphatase [Bacteroidales bacterium]|nr:non-canonical purine NTP diphosphatase [Bacteroidales bacterium]HOX74519.1 non-canonical purine NTP diphosphatase [Bacteroidales bacterium]HPM87619.1 non-canonical purine NTP diphosphatase [Bacteroidales bacterium]HQM70079.1 non-canonical purine NTP diphosphatase [Bacteroidales bacterium]